MSGVLAEVPAPELGAACIQALQAAGVKPEGVDEVIMGNVLAAGWARTRPGRPPIGAGLPAASAPRPSTRSAARA